MKIGLISYDAKHLKTEQILNGFSLNGTLQKHEFQVFALPFNERPLRRIHFHHRPPSDSGAYVSDLCKTYKIKYSKISKDIDIDNSCDLYIISGAGILSEACVKNKKILNCHAGVIPTVRGLDSFKWSIYNKLPIGNTLHFIDSQTDIGAPICIIKTELYKTDTLETLARRHYESEVNILLNFERYLSNNVFDFIEPPFYEATRRMKYDNELELEEKFIEYKKIYLEKMNDKF